MPIIHKATYHEVFVNGGGRVSILDRHILQAEIASVVTYNPGGARGIP